MSDLDRELAAAYRRTAELAYDSMVNVNRRDWTDDQWIADARALMDHIDGSAACLLNGHVNAMLRALDKHADIVREAEQRGARAVREAVEAVLGADDFHVETALGGSDYVRTVIRAATQDGAR